MDRHILMSLFVAIVLFHVLQIISTNDNSAIHFCLSHNPVENTTSNADVTRERTLLIYVIAEYRFFRGFVPKTDRLVVPPTFFPFNFLFLECIFFLAGIINWELRYYLLSHAGLEITESGAFVSSAIKQNIY